MSFFEKDELKLLGLFYLESVIAVSFCIIPAFEVLYFLSIGLTLTQIGFITSVFALTILVFEVPTGAFADLYGRKKSVILGYLTWGITVLGVYFTHDFYKILLIYSILGGISLTFVSGAIDAWPVDNLRKNKRGNLVHSFYTKNRSFINAGLVIAGILGTFLVKHFGLSIIWISTSVSLFVSAIILAFSKEEKIHHKQEKSSFKSFLHQNYSSLKYSVKHKIIFAMIIATLVLALGYSLTSNLIWQPLLQLQGMPVYYLGYILSISGLIGVFAPYLSKPLLKFIKKEKNLIGSLFVLEAIVLSAILFTNSWLILAIILLGTYAIRDINLPLKFSFFQLFVPTKKRATVGSISSMISSIGLVIGAPLAGYIGDNLGLKPTLIIGGIIVFISAIIYFRIKSSKKTIK